MASWTDVAAELETDVQVELLADAPGAIHAVATKAGIAPVPPPLTFWIRYRMWIIGLGLLVAVWFFFFRK